AGCGVTLGCLFLLTRGRRVLTTRYTGCVAELRPRQSPLNVAVWVYVGRQRFWGVTKRPSPNPSDYGLRESSVVRSPKQALLRRSGGGRGVGRDIWRCNQRRSSLPRPAHRTRSAISAPSLSGYFSVTAYLFRTVRPAY